MKVRLKHKFFEKITFAQLFQFHEGPIKTRRTEFLYNRKHGFNSMKVRLKQFFVSKPVRAFYSFNSMKVRLKRVVARVVLVDVLSFNSMKVRLKRCLSC